MTFRKQVVQPITGPHRWKAFLTSFHGILLLMFLGFGTVAWFLFLQPTFDATTQIGILADFNSYGSQLEDYRISNGRYPIQLADLETVDATTPKDRWGEPLIYLSDGTFFILVSTGKGGRAGGENYVALRQEERPHRRDPACRDPETDQILTDLGWFRGCGK